MPKVKRHKGLLKRVKITAGGRVKFKRSCSSHLNSHQTGKKMRQLRDKRLVKAADIKRATGMLHMALRAGDSRRCE